MVRTVKELLSVFYNNSRSLEMFYLLHDLKKGVRLDANELELVAIQKFCSENYLFCEVSDFKAVKVVDEGKGRFSNQVKIVSANYPEEGVRHVYISKDKDFALFLKILEQKQDDSDFGKALGYPDCCVSFFMKYKDSAEQKDLLLPALRNTVDLDAKDVSFSFLLNHAARYFDYTLLSHFPCSFSCEKSKAIAENRFDLLKQYDPDFASELSLFLKYPVLYTEREGVFVFPEGAYSDGVLSFDSVQGTAKNELFSSLEAEKKIEVVNNSTVIVGNRRLEGVGFFRFV